MAIYPAAGDRLNAMTKPGSLTERHAIWHGRTLDLQQNVKAFGAVGNGVADDTAAIQAAIDAMEVSGAFYGTLYFPQGNYKISDPLVIGDGVNDYVSISIRGQSYNSGSNSPLTAASVTLSPTNVNEDAIQFRQSASKSTSLVIEGINVAYASVGTGTAFNMGASGNESTGPILRNCTAWKAGVGFHISTSVNFKMVDCVAHSCGKGVKATGSQVNVPSFENVYFQQCVTSGFSAETPVVGARFSSCVFQSNTGPGVDIVSGTSCMQDVHFDTCWWEFPGTDMIRVSGLSGGRSLDLATFTACHFDGSNGGGGRHVINIVASAASGIFGESLTFIGCHAVNLSGGHVLYTATDPNGSSDPGFHDITWIGGSAGGNFKGIHTAGTSLGQNFFAGDRGITDSSVVTSSVYSVKPPFIRLGTSTNPIIRNDLGTIDFTELAADVAAGATNHARLYAKDNGAGKTQLIVRFPTGAVQVLATEP